MGKLYNQDKTKYKFKCVYCNRPINNSYALKLHEESCKRQNKPYSENSAKNITAASESNQSLKIAGSEIKKEVKTMVENKQSAKEELRQEKIEDDTLEVESFKAPENLTQEELERHYNYHCDNCKAYFMKLKNNCCPNCDTDFSELLKEEYQ